MVATFAALYGFMLPISTSANVIVYGSGQIPFSRMVKTGILVDLSGVLVLVLGVLAMLSIVGVN
jgi:sodium-dependent dicarboxylate transporter 2/3/5